MSLRACASVLCPKGRREEKFAALGSLSLDDTGWVDCPLGWRDPFLPQLRRHMGYVPCLCRTFSFTTDLA